GRDRPLWVADSMYRCNTLTTAQAAKVLQMKYRTRIQYTQTQKAQMWDRWQRGESLHKIARLFDRHHSSVRGILAESGGMRPPMRRRSPRGLEPGRARRERARLGGGTLDPFDGRCARPSAVNDQP